MRLRAEPIGGATASCLAGGMLMRSKPPPADAEFTAFATAHAARLRAAAYLMCGDWHTAQDLTQTALASVYVSWKKIRAERGPYPYAQRTLVNAVLAHRRRRSSTEIPIAEPPDVPAGDGDPELRVILLRALADLPPKARAVLVLRYWEDLPVDEVAALVGCSAGTVKSISSRALHRLRADLESGHLVTNGDSA
jgi:RNA polymerase sigma-70 factor (sigma-E family)